MNCTCTSGCQVCQPVNRRVFSCPSQPQVVRHEHIVRHRHDTVHEIDVIHEHEFNEFDVVRERQITNHNDCRTHEPNYCPGAAPYMPYGGVAPSRMTRRW